LQPGTTADVPIKIEDSDSKEDSIRGGILSGMRELGLPSDLGVVVVVVVVFACRRT
jgi:hypothetical protein